MIGIAGGVMKDLDSPKCQFCDGPKGNVFVIEALSAGKKAVPSDSKQTMYCVTVRIEDNRVGDEFEAGYWGLRLHVTDAIKDSPDKAERLTKRISEVIMALAERKLDEMPELTGPNTWKTGEVE